MKQNILNGQTNQPVYIREDSEVIERLEFEIEQNARDIAEDKIIIGNHSQAIQNEENRLDKIEMTCVNVADFGAIPDGQTDCTAAIQAAVDSLNGQDGKCKNVKVILPPGNYIMNGTVTLYEKSNFIFDASGTSIRYLGNSYPFEVIRGWCSEYRFGVIDCRDTDYWSKPYDYAGTQNIDVSKGCIIFNTTGSSINPNFDTPFTNSNTEFVNIYFGEFHANDNNPCAYLVVEYEEQGQITSDVRWIGDIRFHNGRFFNGYGIYCQEKSVSWYTKTHAPNHLISGVRCYNTTFAGTGDRPLTCGFRWDQPVASVTVDGVTHGLCKGDVGFYGCRSAEQYVTLLDFAADGFDIMVHDFTWIGSSLFNLVYNRPDLTGIENIPTLRFTTKTSGKVIADIYDWDGRKIDKSATVVAGEIIPDNYHVLCSSWGYKDLTGKHGWEMNKYIRYTEWEGTNQYINLPRYYFTRDGVNDFYIKFENAQTNFYINVNRGVQNVLVRTIDSIEAGDMYHIMLAPYDTQTWSDDFSNQQVYIIKENFTPPKFYQHNIHLYNDVDSDAAGRKDVNIQITNKTNTAFTFETLKAYLEEHYEVSNDNRLSATGYYQETSSHCYPIYIIYNNQYTPTVIGFSYIVNSAYTMSSVFSATDTVEDNIIEL